MKRLLCALCLLLALAPFSWGQSGKPQFIVSLRSGQALGRINSEYRTTTRAHITGTAIYLIEQEADDPAAAQKLEKDPDVLALEFNVSLTLDDSAETLFLLDDTAETLFLLDGDSRTTLNGIEVPKAYAEQQALKIIEGDKARAFSSGAATRIATIDTGVDFDHPALKPWLQPGVDLVNGRSASEFDGLDLDDTAETLFLLDNGRISELPSAFGHGTLVAGILHLVAPDAQIVPIKAFDPYGRSSLYTIVEAVYQAIALNVDVINMSFSTNQDSAALRSALSEAWATGITIVSSMGNAALNTQNVFPAAYPQVIAVAATDFEDRVATFSNFGKSVSVSAPGAFVISAFPGDNYVLAWGTSFSAPLVSGTAALSASLNGRGNWQGVRILNTSDDIDVRNPGFEKLIGKGRLNAWRAVQQGQ
jgi:subtilisin family serine protease